MKAMSLNMAELLESDLDQESTTQNKYSFTGEELLNLEFDSLQYLWDPLLNNQGMAALVGSSDVGKSSLLRQLAISIALKETEFLNHKLNVRYGKVIYYTTEDSPRAISMLLNKQLPELDAKELSGLTYIFNSVNALFEIEKELKRGSADAVIIDCFADIFDGHFNDLGSIRRYLNRFNKLSLKYDCAIQRKG